MMVADSTRAIQENSGELETSLTRVKEIVALIEPYSANGSRFGDALMELVVSHGVEGAARLLHEAADALMQNEGFRAAEHAAEAGMASILLPSTIH